MAADGITLEQTVLGHAINNPECFQLFNSDASWKDFAVPNHKVLGYCLTSLAKLGIKKPDEDSFQLVLASYPGEEEKDYGGAQYIRNLKEAFKVETTVENYKVYLERLKLQGFKFRVGNGIVKEVVRLANNPTSTIEDFRSIIRDLTQESEMVTNIGYNFFDARQLADKYLVEIDERKDRKFHSTGFPGLDNFLVEGFAPKQISILAGFTGMAKSTIAINMAHRIAVQGTGAAVFSMESTSMSMLDKLVSTMTQIELERLKKKAGELTEEDRRNIKMALDVIRGLPLLINDQASLSIDGMLFQLQSAIRRGYNPKVVFIDLFGKIEDVDTGENLATRIQKECKRMRVLSKELDMHFVLIVQIGRQGFGRTKGGKIKRPTLIDIKNANAYAEEADLVLLAHRNKYYDPELEDDILEVIIGKQRGGEANETAYFEMFGSTGTLLETDKRPLDL